MNNRHPFFPIFLAIALSLTASPFLLAAADPPTPNQAANATLPNPVPTPPLGPATTTERPSTYTVVAGDSLWLIAHKFHCSVSALKKLNKLTKDTLKPGETLQIPPAKSTKNTPTPTPTPKPKTTSVAPRAVSPVKTAANHPAPHPTQSEPTTYLRAQPVQDFDVPASTFASCPVPPPSDSDSDTAAPAAPAPEPAPVVAETPAPRALPVAPTDLNQPASPTEEPAFTDSTAHSAPASSSAPGDSISVEKNESHESSGHQPGSLFTTTAPSINWGNRFLQEARELADRGIEYDESWQPPGESHSWDMDCSNTSRYLYKITTGIELPRTASDQYYYLHLQNKAWDVPQSQDGFADCQYLRENLKPGDLLFWENTYKPERQPPITHVMVFLGANDKGQWIMAGSQTSRGGEHNRPHGGPDIYVFDPTKPCGGYSTWLGLFHYQGRFCAYGRPLEADRTKLAVAAND